MAISTTNLDSGTDKPKDARADLLAMAVKVNELETSLADLDASLTDTTGTLLRVVPYIDLPASDSTLLLLQSITLYDGVDLSAYSAIGVRNVFRDNPGTARFQFLLAAFDGTSTYTSIIGVGASGATINPTGYTGQIVVPLKAIGTNIPGYANGDTVGEMRFDFGDGSNFGPSSSYAHSEAGLYIDKLKQSAAARENVVSVAKETIFEGVLFPVGHPAALDRIKAVSIFGADPTKFYSIKQIFYLDVGSRLRITIAQSDDTAMTGEVSVADLTISTGASYSGRQNLSLVELAGSGITANVLVDFEDGATAFAAYDAALNYSTAGLPASVCVPSEPGGAASDDSVFLPTVSDVFMRSWIKEIHIEGADPGHQYIVKQVEAIYFSGIPLYRWGVVIRDLTLGIDVCEYKLQSVTLPTTADLLEEWGYAFQGSLSSFTGVHAMIRFDWSVVDWTKSSTTFTTAAAAGLQPSCSHTNDEMDEFLQRPNPAKLITVGAAGDFTTVTDALESLYKYGLSPSGQTTTLPWSNTCGYGHQVLIQIIDDDHTEDVNEALMSPYVVLRGKGMDSTRLYHTSPDGTERLFEYRHSGWREGFTVEQRGPAYIDHADAVNDYSLPAAVGPAVQRYRIRKVNKGMRFVQAGTGAWGWGSGISSGEYQLFEHCVFEKRDATDSTATLGIHTSPGSILPATVRLIGCVGDHAQGTDVVLLCGFAQKTINRCIVDGGNIRIVSMGCSMADNYASMPDKARLRIAWDVFGDAPGALSDSKMEVLRVAPGTAISGNAAGVLFGAGYDQKHGRGELLIMEESATRKLGARLGNCTSVSKTLTMGGLDHVFSNNYTGMTEAAILAEVNATFSGNPLSVVNLAPFVVLGSMRRVYMQASAAVGAKRFVQIAAGKCAPTTGRPDGFAMEAMATDDTDNVILDRRFAASLIPELVGVEGEFGLAAGGQASTSATPKVGMVHKGLVTLY